MSEPIYLGKRRIGTINSYGTAVFSKSQNHILRKIETEKEKGYICLNYNILKGLQRNKRCNQTIAIILKFEEQEYVGRATVEYFIERGIPINFTKTHEFQLAMPISKLFAGTEGYDELMEAVKRVVEDEK